MARLLVHTHVAPYTAGWVEARDNGLYAYTVTVCGRVVDFLLTDDPHKALDKMVESLNVVAKNPHIAAELWALAARNWGLPLGPWHLFRLPYVLEWEVGHRIVAIHNDTNAVLFDPSMSDLKE